MNIYARKGEVVTCPDGHPMFEFTQDVLIGDYSDASQLKSICSLPDPVNGNSYDNCPICNQCMVPWEVRDCLIGTIFYINGKLRVGSYDEE